MVGKLLWRGMLAGLIAACLSALFAFAFVEPHIDRAIAFEEAHAVAAHAGMATEEELVSRAVQSTAGLLTALSLYGAALGGLFALAFAYAYGRIARIGPRTLALALAAAGFVVIVVIPALKYPPTPPAVGRHETVGLRTGAFFAMIALSVLAAVAATRLRSALRLDTLTGMAAAAVFYTGLIWLAQHFLPVIDEVPADFPATLLWDYRAASLLAQLVLWLAIGFLFGPFAERQLRRGT